MSFAKLNTEQQKVEDLKKKINEHVGMRESDFDKKSLQITFTSDEILTMQYLLNKATGESPAEGTNTPSSPVSAEDIIFELWGKEAQLYDVGKQETLSATTAYQIGKSVALEYAAQFKHENYFEECLTKIAHDYTAASPIVVFDSISGEETQFDNVEEAKEFILETMTDPDEGIHPEIESMHVYRKLYDIDVNKNCDGNGYKVEFIGFKEESKQDAEQPRQSDDEAIVFEFEDYFAKDETLVALYFALRAYIERKKKEAEPGKYFPTSLSAEGMLIHIEKNYPAEFEEAKKEYEGTQVNKTNWISVKTALPDKDVDVLMLGLGGAAIAVGHYNPEKEHWYYTDVSLCNGHITHWMPLPELPKEDENGKA